jgi:nucleotide-binding universal stress UspA family protein
MSATTEVPRGNASLGDEKEMGLGPILVAIDGTPSSDSVLRAAAQLATRAKAEVVALTVIEPLEPLFADFGWLVPPADMERARRQRVSEALKLQTARVLGATTKWRIEIREGDAPSVIARAARELSARVIVVGLGHHDLLDRLFGGETALHTLRRAGTPVLAVSESFKDLPTRVLVATDFGSPSVEAARVALRLFPGIRVLKLVHVAPRLELQPEIFAAWMALYGEDVTPAFERVKSEMRVPDTVTVQEVVLEGKASREILRLAASGDVDLIVTGSRGAGLFDRILVGSTATGLVRAAQCSVLAVPASAPARVKRGTADRLTTTVPEARWAAELEEFSKRNQGRRTALEVDDPEIGAQAQEHDYPLLGVAYDHHDRRVEIMLGKFRGVDRHLTRSIGDVHSIDRLRDEHGRDSILRIAHGNGQTMLTFER